MKEKIIIAVSEYVAGRTMVHMIRLLRRLTNEPYIELAPLFDQ